jgi:serine phosphatase RsbU (regulator of sigma subunit)
MAWAGADFLRFFGYEFSIFGFIGAERIVVLENYELILRAATTVGSILALLTILFREQRRIAQDRAAMAGEMEAAREIQQYLIPEKMPLTPGLTIRSVYQPSREVGGDFFQVLPDARDGSTLIVVGDVAGKGLKAGMLSALIVGSIRTSFKFTSDPSKILVLLNERLQGRGLVTCMAMRIDGEGKVDLANAGHLPPYVNGKELILDGALPLGALPDLLFPTTRIQLDTGDAMLLVSDGVVEARNEGGELFGFERTAAISGKSAAQIAQAAQAFGQEDDITVLTLTFAGVGVLHA